MEMNVKTNSSPTAPKPSKQTGWRIRWSLLRPHTLTAARTCFHRNSIFDAGRRYKSNTSSSFPYDASCLSSHSSKEQTCLMNTLIIKRTRSRRFSWYRRRYRSRWHSAKTVLNLAFGFFGIAILLGVYICINSSWWLPQSVLFVWPLLTFIQVAHFQLHIHHLES